MVSKPDIKCTDFKVQDGKFRQKLTLRKASTCPETTKYMVQGPSTTDTKVYGV